MNNVALTAGTMLTVPRADVQPGDRSGQQRRALDTERRPRTIRSTPGAHESGGGWAADSAGTSSAAISQPLMAANNSGRAVSVWLQGGSVFASAYDRSRKFGRPR